METTQAYFENIQEVIYKNLAQATKSIHIAVGLFSDSILFQLLCSKVQSRIDIHLLLFNSNIDGNFEKINFSELKQKGGNVYHIDNKGCKEFCIIDGNITMQCSSNLAHREEFGYYQYEFLRIKPNDKPYADQFKNEFNRIVERYFALDKWIPYRKKDKWGLCDKQKNIVLPCVYDRTYCYAESFSRFEKDGKWGFINDFGEIFVDNLYMYVYPFHLGYAIVYKNRNQNQGCINKEGKLIVDCLYNHIQLLNISPLWNDLILVEKEFWYKGLINTKGEEILPCIYQKIFLDENEDYIHVINYVNSSNKYPNYHGVFDRYGNQLISFKYTYIRQCQYGYFIATKVGGMGVIDRHENEIVPFEYDKIEIVSNSLIIVSVGIFTYKKYYIFEELNGKFIRKGYEYFRNYSEKLLLVSNNNKYGFINKFTKAKINCIFDEVGEKLVEGYAMVRKGEKWHYIDDVGEKVIPNFIKEKYSFNKLKNNTINKDLLEYQMLNTCIENNKFYIEPFSDTLFKATTYKNGYNKGIVDKKGCEIIPLNYYDISIIFDSFFLLKSFNGKYGYATNYGKRIMSCIYDELKKISDFLVKIKIDNKYGILDYNGNIIFPCIFDEIGNFQDGLACICKEKKWGYINLLGHIAIDFIYDDAFSFSQELAGIKLNDKYGYINKYGEVAIALKYEVASNFNDKLLAIVKLHGKEGIIDTNGVEYWED